MLTREAFVTVGYKTDLESKTLLTKINELPPPQEGVEFYRSVFAFREEDLAGKDSLREVSDKVPVYAEFLPIDLDNSNDLGKVWNEAREVSRLLNSNLVPHYTCFSGNKGFHILVPTESFGFRPTEDNEILKRMAIALAGDKESFDPSVYNKTRVFRYPGSYNKKGGLYKILVSLDDTIEEIIEKAKTPETSKLVFRSNLNSFMVKLFEEASVKENRHQTQYTGHIFDSIFEQAPEGRRNETAYTVARKLARRGIGEADALSIMVEFWNPKYVNPPLSPDELQKIIENAYKKGYNPVDDNVTVARVSENISVCLSEAIQDIQLNPGGFITGYKDLDVFTMGFEPETLNFILGRSGNFKSTLLTNIMQRGSYHAKKPALYFSMEMGRRTLVPRLIQAAESVSKKQALKMIEEAGSHDAFEKTVDMYKHVKFIWKSDLTTEMMLAIIDTHLEKYGELSAIGIDYLSLFRGCNNNTERTAKQCQELKGIIAKQSKCPVICLAQAKQIYEGRDGDIELDRRSPGDTDSILRLGDNCFGLWGHWSNDGTGDRKDIYGRFFKARGFDEELFGADPYFHMELDKPRLNVLDFKHCPTTPTFRQVGSHGDN